MNMLSPKVDFGTNQDDLMPRNAANDVGISFDAALESMHELLLKRFADRKIRVYEAGGGSTSYLPNELVRNSKVTVVDSDEEQLRRNNYAAVKICGDVQLEKFPPASFDLIVCYNVIEHLEYPDQALTNFFDALAPGGLVLIASPNPHSFFGIVTKHTPHWFHVWCYRTLLRRKDAGRPGSPPFPTIYHPLLSPHQLIEFSRNHGCKIVSFKEIETVQIGALQHERPAIARLLRLFIRVLEIVTRKPLRNGDYQIVLEKPATKPTR